MSTPSSPRPAPGRARRVCAVAAASAAAVLLPALLPVLLAAPASAATPVTWQDPAPMSLLQALLIYGGIPLALVLVITTLVLAPSIIRGDRQQRGVASWTEPQWFGGPGQAVAAGGHDHRPELGAGAAGAGEETGAGSGAGSSHQAGGASARW